MIQLIDIVSQDIRLVKRIYSTNIIEKVVE